MNMKKKRLRYLGMSQTTNRNEFVVCGKGPCRPFLLSKLSEKTPAKCLIWPGMNRMFFCVFGNDVLDVPALPHIFSIGGFLHEKNAVFTAYSVCFHRSEGCGGNPRGYRPVQPNKTHGHQKEVCIMPFREDRGQARPPQKGKRGASVAVTVNW